MKLFVCVLASSLALGQSPVQRPAPAAYQTPILHVEDGLRGAIERYTADRGSLLRFYDIPMSPVTDGVMRTYYQAWQASLERVPFDSLSLDARVDFVLFRNKLSHELKMLDLTRRRTEETRSILPFAPGIIALQEARQRIDPLDPAKAAASLARMDKQVEELIHGIEGGKTAAGARRTAALRAARTIGDLRTILKEWFTFYNEYDPSFTWWVALPYKSFDAALQKYAALVREKLAGLAKDDRDTILGDPIGKDALMSELAYELAPYTPEQLIAIANREFAWCEREMLKASRELGFGEDWRGALEHVKNLHVPPGQQPALVLAQALEAADYVEKHNLITVPALARDTFRMEMMTPERQRINPFFTGGEMISVSFPTSGMTHEQKLMSMRGNNIHFSRATVLHELIPGHYLQEFMTNRYRPYRGLFETPFWLEGWAVYWEMLLWDHGFAKSAENRIGMLFWRMHRCARIIFSLSFHLGKMTAQECVDFLVNRVGHEVENAAAEVRRSFEADYPPLYQAGYMLGGLQFRALHKEMVGSGRMTDRAFHDAILRLNYLPVELVRATLLKQSISKNFTASWKFYGDLVPAQ